MATSCLVVLRSDELWYKAIKVRYNGYINDAGRILLEHYNTLEAVEKLISGGDCTCLCEDVEKIERIGTPPVEFEAETFSEENCWGNYTYIFDAFEGDGWIVTLRGNNETQKGGYFHFSKLSEAIDIGNIDCRSIVFALIEASLEKTLDSAKISYGNSINGVKPIYRNSKKVYEVDLNEIFDLDGDEEISIATYSSSFYEIIGEKIDNEMMNILSAVNNCENFLAKDDYGHSVCKKACELKGFLTDFVYGVDRFLNLVEIESVLTYGIDDPLLLKSFWEEGGYSDLVWKFSGCVNVSVGHYKGKVWRIVPRYFSEHYNLYWFKFGVNWNMLKLTEIKSLKDWCKQSIVQVYSTEYFTTAEDKILDKEAKKIKMVIQNAYNKMLSKQQRNKRS